MKQELIKRLYDSEDGFVERKPENCKDRELRKELVAFANSVPEEFYAVIFLGVSDTGEPVGVVNPDERQKRIRRVAESDCYPPVKIQMHVLEEKEKLFLAIVVGHSLKKPHFAG
ncbi:MAG: ATP-binding protein [Sedimenticola sp.]